MTLVSCSKLQIWKCWGRPWYPAQPQTLSAPLVWSLLVSKNYICISKLDLVLRNQLLSLFLLLPATLLLFVSCVLVYSPNPVLNPGDTMARVATAEDLSALHPSSPGIAFTPGPHSAQNWASLSGSRQRSVRSAADLRWSLSAGSLGTLNQNPLLLRGQALCATSLSPFCPVVCLRLRGAFRCSTLQQSGSPWALWGTLPPLLWDQPSATGTPRLLDPVGVNGIGLVLLRERGWKREPWPFSPTLVPPACMWGIRVLIFFPSLQSIGIWETPSLDHRLASALKSLQDHCFQL